MVDPGKHRNPFIDRMLYEMCIQRYLSANEQHRRCRNVGMIHSAALPRLSNARFRAGRCYSRGLYSAWSGLRNLAVATQIQVPVAAD